MSHCWGTEINVQLSAGALSCSLCHFYKVEALRIHNRRLNFVHVNSQTLRRSSGNPISILFISSFVCLPALQFEFGTMGTLRYCCLINYVWGCKYKSLDTSGTVFKRAVLLWKETLALIKRHTFISTACNSGFHSCQQWMHDAGGYASQWPLRNKNCLIPFQLV